MSDECSGSVIVLNERAVALPALQIMVRTGRFNLEMNGVQEVSADFDPLLNRDRLWMPESGSRYYIKPDRERPELLIPFFSEQAKEVCRFGFSGRQYERTYIYGNQYDGRMASLYAQSLAEVLSGETQSGVFMALHLILTAVGKLRDWPVPIEVQDQIETMQICMGRPFVAQIEAETALFFPPAGVEESILAEWRYDPHSNSTMI